MVTVDLVARHIDHIRQFFMWGFPFETHSDSWQTILAMREAVRVTAKYGKQPDMRLDLFTPLPGTTIPPECHELEPVPPDAPYGGSFVAVRPDLEPEVRDLVARYPRLFSVYYTVRHEEFSSKADISSRLRLSQR